LYIYKLDGLHCTPAEVSITLYLYPEYIEQKPIEYHPRPEGAEFGLIFDTAEDFRKRFPDDIVWSNTNLANVQDGKKLFELCVGVFAEEMNKW